MFCQLIRKIFYNFICNTIYSIIIISKFWKISFNQKINCDSFFISYRSYFRIFYCWQRICYNRNPSNSISNINTMICIYKSHLSFLIIIFIMHIMNYIHCFCIYSRNIIHNHFKIFHYFIIIKWTISNSWNIW